MWSKLLIITCKSNDLGWDYQTFGTWVTGGNGSGKAGNYSIG